MKMEMRFICKYLLVANILAGSLISCEKKPNNVPQMNFDCIQVSRDIPLTDDAEAPRCKIRMQLQEFKGNSDKSKIINKQKTTSMLYSSPIFFFSI